MEYSYYMLGDYLTIREKLNLTRCERNNKTNKSDSGVQTLSSIFCTFIIYPSLRNFFRESLKLFFLYGSLQAVHTNFHAKSGVCSSKNGRVMAISLIFPSLRIFFRESLKLFFCMDPCRQFIRTSMQNLESVAQKMSELLH